MECIYSGMENRVLLKQYIRSLNIIANLDYPMQWPSLYDHAMAFLT